MDKNIGIVPYIIFVLFCPIVFIFGCMSGIDKYIHVTTGYIDKNGLSLKAYIIGYKLGYREFIDYQKRVHKKYFEKVEDEFNE